AGHFRIRNLNDFVDLSRYRGTWELSVDGDVVRRGRLPALRVAPGGSLDVTLDVATERAGERLGTIRFFLRRATDWADAGHEVAWQQVPLPSSRYTSRRGRLAIPTEADGAVVLDADGVRAAFDAETGVRSALSRGR